MKKSESLRFFKNKMSSRVGTYAISTINYDTWMNDPIVNVTPKGKKGKPAKEIINPIFQECSEYTDDPFWKTKFTSAAIGKFPPKFSYHDGVLFYKRGARTITMEVKNQAESVINECIDFFRANGGIFSPLDEKISIESRQNKALLNEQRPPLEWSKINKKIKECLISYYITNLSKAMSLAPNESAQLLKVIRCGISYKLFGRQNIRLTDTKIYTIDGLLWDNENRQFYIDPTLTPVLSRSSKSSKTLSSDNSDITNITEKDRIPQFSTKWIKYIDSLDKKVDRTSKRIHRNKNIMSAIPSPVVSQPRIKLNIINDANNYSSPVSTVTSPLTSTLTSNVTSSTEDDDYDSYDSDYDSSYDSDYDSDCE